MKKRIVASSIVCLAAFFVSADAPNTNVPAGWTAITTMAQINALGPQTDNYGGASGNYVNRLTGDVMINLSGYGIWKSSNKGSTWARIDNNTLTGRCENGRCVNVDQNDPKRIAVFMLDGNAGYTSDGTTWHKMTQVWGRNWDFGSIDWGTADPKVMIANAHESPGGQVYKTTDGAVTWQLCNFTMAPNPDNTGMLGVMDATTFIYGSGNGIQRSTNLGGNWTQVSTQNSTLRVPVLFKGKHYLGQTQLLVSADKGATWATQGTALPGGDKIYDIWFGSDENTMVVTGQSNIYKSINAGTSWTTISTRPDNGNYYSFNPKWFGRCSWDPINNVLYATAMNNMAIKKELGGSSAQVRALPARAGQELTVLNSTIRFDQPFNQFEIFSLNGVLVFGQQMAPALSAPVPQSAQISQLPLIYKITTTQGTAHQILR